MTDTTTQPREQAAIDLNTVEDFWKRAQKDRQLPCTDPAEILALIAMARATPVAAPEAPTDERKNIAEVKRTSDMGLSLRFLSARACSAFERYLASTGAAPEAPDSEQQACAHCKRLPGDPEGTCDWMECPVGSVVAATTASASEPAEYQYRTRPTWRAEGEGWTEWAKCSKESYGDYIKTPVNHDWQYEARVLYEGRAPAPSRDAAPIKTWQERRNNGEARSIIEGIQAEISDLRAALTQQSAAQAPAETSLSAPHTYAAFRSRYYCERMKMPSDQEVFDAGMRAGRDIQWPERAAQAAHAGADTELVAAVRKLVRAKGRFHTEQNYNALADALSNYDAALAATEKKEQK